MYTTADDWIERFKAAGCRMMVDGITLRTVGRNPSEECDTLWAEITGPENVDKWNAVEARVRELVGPFYGWTYFP